MRFTPEQRAQLEEMRDRYRDTATLFLEVAEKLRAELKRRGMTDEQIDQELSKRPRPRQRRKKSI